MNRAKWLSKLGPSHSPWAVRILKSLLHELGNLVGEPVDVVGLHVTTFAQSGHLAQQPLLALDQG